MINGFYIGVLGGGMKMFSLTRLYAYVATSALCLSGVAHAQIASDGVSVVVDGQTDTDVYLGDAGQTIVTVADANSDGLSYNTYSRFDVSQSGLELDNRISAARTIINEVTSTNPSLIEGHVEVLGQRAHVILANPNGITVDGGAFINTGGVLLTTAATQFVSRVPAPGQTQTNAVFEVSDGTIYIGPNGLSGAMDALHLVADQIRIDGLVDNTSGSGFSGVNLYAGKTVTEVDVSIVPQNDLSAWASTSAATDDGEPQSPSAEYLIDISRTGGINSSRIRAVVNDAGAGVRYAGSALVTRSNFALNVDGTIDIGSATIVTAAGIDLSARDIVSSDTSQITQLFAETGGVNITAQNAIHITNPQLTANDELGVVINAGTDVNLTASDTGLFSLITSAGDVAITAGGSLDLGSVSANVQRDTTLTASEISITSPQQRGVWVSGGALNVSSAVGGVSIEGARMDAAMVALESASTISLSSVDADRRGVLFATDGDINLTAPDDILVHSARLVTQNGDINIASSGVFDAIIDIPGGTRAADTSLVSESRDGPSWLLGLVDDRRRTMRIDYGEAPEAWVDSTLTAFGSINISADNGISFLGSALNANAGSINLSAPSVLLEGMIAGTLNYERSCIIFCTASGSGEISVTGGILNASQQVNINAPDAFANIGGAVTGLGGVTITSDDIYLSGYYIPTVVERSAGMSNLWAGNYAFVYWQDLYGGIFSDSGSIVFDSDNAVRADYVDLDESKTVARSGLIVKAPRLTTPVGSHQTGLLAGFEWLFGDQ